LPMHAGEPITVAAAQNGIKPAEAGVSLLWFCDRLDPVPPGDSFWLRYTADLSRNPPPAPPPSGPTWSGITVTFDQTIPSGTYAIIGFEHWSPTAIAARIVIPSQLPRPGVVAMNGGIAFNGGARTHHAFYHGHLGVYGTFQTTSPPSIEVLT